MENTFKIVQKLNENLYENTKNENIWFSYSADNFVESVAFNSIDNHHSVKIELWSSENSQQFYREDTDDYEPLEDTLKRELKKAVNSLKYTVEYL